MARRERILKRVLVEPGTPAGLADRDSAWKGGEEFEQLSEAKLKGTAKAILTQGVKELSDAQELLWASDTLRAPRRVPGASTPRARTRRSST